MIERDNLAILLKSHFPLILIESHEEQRALGLLRGLVTGQDRSLFTWTVTRGLEPMLNGGASAWRVEGLALCDDAPSGATERTTDPEAMLATVGRTLRHSVVVLLDFHPYLSHPNIVRLLKEIALDFYVGGNILVLLSHALELPEDLRRYSARFELSLPDRGRLRELILEEASLWRSRHGNERVKADPQAVELLARNLVGLTVTDATRLIRNAIYNDGAITRSDLADVMAAKYELIGQGGALSFEYDTATFADVGGFGRLKAWLDKRRLPFLDMTGPGLDVPKGLLLAGIQGGGKSLAAKAVAGAWQLPLLRLDLGALYDKYIGETEKNVRTALKAADVLAPCVLWIDEIEKGVSTGDSDNGTSQRVLGTLLTWMAERRSRVFVVATANDIAALPPELVRKGRLDEIFFVDLPSATARAEILRAHLRKRGIATEGFVLHEAVAASEGFSGAELEQAVVAARYSAQADGVSLGAAHLLAEIRQTRPLSVVMGERIAALRAWAQARTVPAD